MYSYVQWCSPNVYSWVTIITMVFPFFLSHIYRFSDLQNNIAVIDLVYIQIRNIFFEFQQHSGTVDSGSLKVFDTQY